MGLLHCGLGILALLGILIDTREVGGLNPWIKPLKFDLSIAIFLWTMAWILAKLPTDFARRIGRGMAAAMLLETILLNMQAFRGVKSHFNNASVFDASVYTAMGIVILYNFSLVLRVTLRFFRGTFSLPKPTLLGIQLGLLSLVFGNLFGIYMSAQPGHSVGAPDGGPGIPFLNWSRTSGDLRVAHFAALHGIQILLLAGAFFSRPEMKLTERSRLLYLNLVFAVYLTLCVALFVQALLGIPALPV
jgi:hypothetical protein